MRIVALAQQKGGVGKSAAAINLACHAVAAKAKTALIDMDVDQATTLKWSKRRSGDMAGPFVAPANATTLKELLIRLKEERFEWVFIDLPGRNAAGANAGLVAADIVLVPCRPLDVDIEASVATITAARRAGKRYAYLMNIAPAQKGNLRANQVMLTLAALRHPVVPTIIVQRIAVPDAIAKGRGVIEMETKPKSESIDEFQELFDWLEKEVKH